jgi:fibronectin type 3 domain-containing protein
MQLVKIASSAILVLLFSACSINNLNQPERPKIDNTIEVIDNSSIKTISDINAIAFEWNKVNDPRVSGYHFYRGNAKKDANKLVLIKTIDNRHTTHFVDTNVEANTKYIYKISSATKSEIESATTKEYYVSTLANLPKIPLIQAISNLPRQIKVIWRPHLSQKVNKYILQRATPTKAQWDNLTTIDGRLQAEYIDDDLGDNKIYLYRVIAKTFDNLESMPSEAVQAKTKPLPLGVENLQITQDQPRRIDITWEASKTTDVLKYNIYRSAYDTFGFSKQKILKSSQLTYSDKVDSDGKRYFYKITSVDVDELESKTDIAPKMGVTLSKPIKPIITLGQIQGGKAILNWQAGDDRAVSYTIYKTITKNFFESKTVKLNNISALRYQDEEILRGVKYSYSIQSVDRHGLRSEKTESTTLVLPPEIK